MFRGWVKLWRKLIEDEAFQDSVLLKVLIWCLLKACHKGESFPVKTGRGVTTVTLQPGQLIFGRNQAAKELKIPPATAHRKMVRLEKLGFLIIQPDTHYSIISIARWDTYQGTERGGDQASDQPLINQRSHTRSIKNVKKDISVVHHAGVTVPLEEGVREVLSRLNEKRCEIVGNGVRPITQDKEIRARLTDKEGAASVVECCRVVLTKADDPHFRENPKYFHPSTLFRKANFKKYLDEAEIARAHRARGDQW